MRTRCIAWFGAALLALLICPLSEAHALPGTHPSAVSTFDTRGSTVVMAYRQGLVFDGTSRVFSYNANFTATNGNFSAQFGAHYLQLKPQPSELMMHGAAASGVALFSLPLSDRHPNGVPKLALNPYFGVVPTAAVSGPKNFMSVPVNLGLGLSIAPTGWLSFTPWLEGAPSANLDTEVSELDFTAALQSNIDDPNIDPDTQEILLIAEEDINQVLQDSVDLRFSTHFAVRAGVSAVAHLGDTWDINAYLEATTFGSLFGGQFIAQGGLGVSFHWDDVVPEVLPPEQRLKNESCEDIENRFMACPNYRGQAPPVNDPEQTPKDNTQKEGAPADSQLEAPAPAAPATGAPSAPQPANDRVPNSPLFDSPGPDADEPVPAAPPRPPPPASGDPTLPPAP